MIAATQGGYSRINVRNVKAERGVNISVNAAICPPNSTVSVETTLSFASSPVNKAVEARQSLKPSGAKMGEMNDPKTASMLSD